MHIGFVIGLITAIILLLIDVLVRNEHIEGGDDSRNQLCIRFSDIPNRMKYQPGKSSGRSSIHIGQRKLFLNCLQFMAQYKPKIVVYAGAAPCMYIWKLHNMFPDTKFLLIDPREVCIIKEKGITHYDEPDGVEYLEIANDKSIYYKGALNVNYKGKILNKADAKGLKFDGPIILNHPITIIENIFTIDLAKKVKELGDVAFWSDIRTMAVKNEVPTEFDIYFNSAQQLTWVDIMRPSVSMLKFRCPYIERLDGYVPADDAYVEYFDHCKEIGVDFMSDYKSKKFRYMEGDVFIQPWAGGSSSEGRLVFTDVKFKEWDCSEYEDKFFYYNNVARLNKYTDHEISKKHCIDRCGDCALEAEIWKSYTDDVLNEMISLSDYLSLNYRSLCTMGHGRAY